MRVSAEWQADWLKKQSLWIKKQSDKVYLSPALQEEYRLSVGTIMPISSGDVSR
jgi:hypothetical protein